jgi:CHASE2 domain-containing sensor protein
MIDSTTPAPQLSTRGARFWQDKILKNYNKLVIAAGALVLVIGFLTGGLHSLNTGLANIVFDVHERPASGDVIIVAFDQESRAAMGGQSATREQHANVIRILTDAGAARIGMNFDFREASDANVDSKLIEAAKYATGRLVLSATSEHTLSSDDNFNFQEPFPALSAVAELGGVHLHLDDHGHVHGHHLVHAWRDGVIQSFASKIVESKTTEPQQFHLDFSINPDSIPTYSYNDILNRQVPTSEIKGKYIFVGSTEGFAGGSALVPVYGTLHKIELHALTGEALVQGRLITEPSPIVNLLVALFVFLGFTSIFLMFRGKTNTIIAVTTTAAMIGLFVTSLCYSTWQLPLGSAGLSVMLALAVSS